MPIIDGHMDTVYALNFSRRKFAERSENGHVDLPRLKEGGVKLVFFAVFPASSPYYIAAGVDRWFSLVEPPENNLKTKLTELSGNIDQILESAWLTEVIDDYQLQWEQKIESMNSLEEVSQLLTSLRDQVQKLYDQFFNQQSA